MSINTIHVTLVQSRSQHTQPLDTSVGAASFLSLQHMELSSSYLCVVLAFLLSAYNIVPSLGDGVKVTAKYHDFTLGENPILRCHIVGTSPSRFLSWTKTSPSSTPLLSSPSASTAKFATLPSDSKIWEIQINEVKKSDEGTYYCNAEINGHAVSDHVSIRVTVPVIVAYGAAAFERSPATLYCNGSDYRLIVWNFRGLRVQLGRGGVTSPGRGETLNFARVSRRQNGTYECVPRPNAGGTSYAHLIVYVLPEITQQPVSTTVKPGEKGKFTCSIAGNPRPPVVWLTGNGTVVKQSSRLSIRVLSYTNNETRSQLTIRKATAKDDGYYYCDAVVGGVGAVKSKSAKLTVKKSSNTILMFLTAYKSLYFGRRGTLQCGNGENDGTNLKTANGELVINNVTFFDAGTYECHIRVPAANMNLSQKINLTVIGPPGQPNDVKLSIFEDSQRRVQICVNWTRPSWNGNIPVMTFIIYYRLKSPLETVWKVGKNARDSSQMSATIVADGVFTLFPSVVFEVKVEAINKAGSQNSTPVLGQLIYGTTSLVTKSNSSAQACRSQPSFFLISCSVALFCSP
ncbi:cell adhesion molecule DSCAML1-like isoform X2 [Oscarella lobularis]|uniref:cell adhesion molecule DSCAML1-like isoform X2 n=1 Tax=Oscarella lobularis TaxID=121494 RepID=UPI00331438F9